MFIVIPAQAGTSCPRIARAPGPACAGMDVGVQRVTAATAAATVSRFARFSAATQMRPLSSA